MNHIYEGFGPTLAAEEGLVVDHETLRRWLLQEKIWSKQRKRCPYRKRRERRAQFGELGLVVATQKKTTLSLH